MRQTDINCSNINQDKFVLDLFNNNEMVANCKDALIYFSFLGKTFFNM